MKISVTKTAIVQLVPDELDATQLNLLLECLDVAYKVHDISREKVYVLECPHKDKMQQIISLKEVIQENITLNEKS